MTKEVRTVYLNYRTRVGDRVPLKGRGIFRVERSSDEETERGYLTTLIKDGDPLRKQIDDRIPQLEQISNKNKQPRPYRERWYQLWRKPVKKGDR